MTDGHCDDLTGGENEPSVKTFWIPACAEMTVK